jgi:hypothetical protein
VTGPVQHDVRFEAMPGDSGYAYLRAVCEPCAWSVALESGHTLAELTRLVQMHSGTTVVSAVSRDGSAVLSPADLLTALSALQDASEFCETGSREQYIELAGQLGVDL